MSVSVRITGAVVCLLLTLASPGRVQTSPRAKGPERPEREERRVADVRSRLRRAHELLSSSQYARAIGIYNVACPETVRLGKRDWASVCFNNLGAAYFATFHYRDALQAFLSARAIADQIGDWASISALSTNISSIYLEMGELDASVEAAERGVEAAERKAYPGGRAKAMLQLGLLRVRQGRIEDAMRLVGDSIRLADRDGDDATVAQAWDRLGAEFLGQGDLTRADAALTEGFRLRRARGARGVLSSYWHLGKLRLAQGDLRSAAVLLDEAVQRRNDATNLIPDWSVLHTRGRVRLAQGRLPEALADLRAALESARRWRREVLPADATRVSSESELQQIYSSFIDAGNRWFAVTGDHGLAHDTFQAAEENRAASLQALVAEPADRRRTLPPEYWESVAQLRASEAALARGENPAARALRQTLRGRVMEIEAATGHNPPVRGGRLLADTHRALGRDDVYLSFHLGENASGLWAVTHNGFMLRRLPPKSTLVAAAARFSAAVEAEDAGAARLGASLYRTLFGSVEPLAGRKRRWILALDEPLFTVPFAALVTGGLPDRPVYLAQRHVLQIATGANMLQASGQPPWTQSLDGAFLGVGDAVYNTADPRWTAGAGPTQPAALPLPRLAASSVEIRSCARTWAGAGGQSFVLEGADVSRERFQEQLRGQPAIIHFATHFLEARQAPHHGLIALSLGANRQPDFLGPTDLLHARVTAGLVVLSGCGSGRGDTLPGAGLMGLTRAWLAAGARAVAASHWSVPDESGALFQDFYARLRGAPSSGPAVALQAAQMEMLRSGSWRSRPRYWAAFFIMGNS